MLRGTRPVAQRALGLLQRSNAATPQLSFTRAITTRAVRPGSLRALAGGQLTHKASYADKSPPLQVGRDAEDEKRLGQQKLKSDPSAVSTESSVRHFYEPAEPSPDGAKPQVSDGLKHDLGIVKDTFSVANVPKESYVLGLAGTLPYLATSLSTVYLSWNINTEWVSSSGFVNSFMLTQESAHWWLNVIEPIQLGYGAVIISFLGAIHWGLEYAEKQPSRRRTRFRYGLGVLASVAAWPTMFLPIEFALTSQLAAFTGLYFADTTATKRGWAPPWYSSYRFVLTAIVGAAITISLIGRAKVGDAKPRLSGLSRKFHETHGEEQYSEKWAKLEEVEREKQKKKKEEEEKKRKEEEKKAKEEEKKAKEEEKKNKKKDSKGKGDEKKQQQGSKDEEKKEEQDSDDSAEEKSDDGEKADEEEKKDDKAEKKDDDAEKKEEGADDKQEDGDKEEKGDDAAKDEKKDDKEAKEDSEGKDEKKEKK